jgi:hypothetical protein
LLRWDRHLTGGGKIEWNVMAGEVELNRVAADEALLLGRVMEGLGRNYTVRSRSGLTRLEPSVSTLERALAHEALLHEYHPTREWFESIRGTWDCKDHLAKLPALIGAAQTVLVRAQLQNFLVGLVARTYEPGCKMDTVLTLKSDQGTKKSTFFFEIAPAGRFSSTAMDFKNKDSLMQMQAFSVVELAEGVGMTKQGDEEIKAFTSQRSDDFRTPYGKRLKSYPRHAVLCCTTNDPKFRDPTGTRRFDLVPLTGTVDIKAVRALKEQLWAQAIHLYFAAETCADCKASADGEDRCPAHRWWLGKDLEKQRDAINALDTVELPCVDWLKGFIHRVKTGGFADKQGLHSAGKVWAWHDLYEVTTADLVEEMKGLEHREDRQLKQEMGTALRKLGYAKKEDSAGITVWRSPDWQPKSKERAAFEAEQLAERMAAVAKVARQLATEEVQGTSATVVSIHARPAERRPDGATAHPGDTNGTSP